MLRTPIPILVMSLALALLAWTRAAGTSHSPGPDDRVLLDTVMAITFIDGKMTNSRHNSSVPQLICVGGNVGCLDENLPMAILCMNEGRDKHLNTIKWKCSYSKDLEENGILLQKVNISCEGYDYPNDPYIVKGSCSLKYELNWADGLDADEDESFGSWIILIVVGLMWILLILCCLALRYSCEITSKSPPNSEADQISYVSHHNYEGYLPVDDSSSSSTPDTLSR